MPSSLTSAWQALSSNPVVLVSIGVIVLLLVVAALRVLFVFRRLRRADRLGREASAGLPREDLPLTSFNRKGQPGDPVNFEMMGTVSQVGAAFGAAGWYRADEIDLVTSVRISVDSVLGLKYSTAPVSNLYLFGRKEDLAFERPGRSVRERDHIRLWNTGRDAPDGRPIWIGGATRDTKVELAKTNHLPTHKIAPDIDAERDLVVSELAVTGWVVEDIWRPGFGKETRGVNGTGDPWYTDGRVAVLMLANVWAPPLAAQVRTPLGASLVHAAAWLLRWRLPRKGRERAQQERARQAERGRAS